MPGFVSGASLEQLLISMPYYDKTNNLVKYTQFEAGYWNDHTTGYANADGVVAIFSWLNKLNPDWSDIAQGDQTIFEGVTGTGFIPCENIVTMQVQITEPGAKTDYWWGTTEFAKFGVFAFSFQGFRQTPPIWINWQQQSTNAPQTQADGFWYSLGPGVQATFLAGLSGAETPPGISKVPPVYAYSNTSGPVFPLLADQTPTSAYGPEILP